MKILFATSSFGGGGITSYGKEVIDNYSKDNELSVLIGSDKVSPITAEGVKVYYYDCKDLSVTNAKNVIRLINETIKPEIILSSNAHIISLIAPYLSDDIRIITISHSLKYEAADMAAISHKYVDKIIAASSSYNKKYMEDRFSIDDPQKIEVILNFVADIEDSKTYISNKSNNKELIIVYPGACLSSKGPDVMLNVVKALEMTDIKFKFYWMGKTDIPLSKYFKFIKFKNIKEIVNDSRIVFPGRLPEREDAVKLISSANIFMAPSRREGCPMALLEAMRAGAIPFVADFGNANREIVKNGVNGFVINHNDIDKWVEQIRDIANAHSKYQDFYNESRNTFEDTLTYRVWKINMDNALYYCGNNHNNRKKNISSYALKLRSIYFKWIKLKCKLEARVEEDLVVYLGLLKTRRTAKH